MSRLYLVAVKGKVEPPTGNILAYRMQLKISFMLDDGTAMPTRALPGPHGDGGLRSGSRHSVLSYISIN
jgi:hypothetical protein